MILRDYNGEKIHKGNTNYMIIAHRGYAKNVPENTIASFVEAADAGFDGVEIDIRQTMDGVYVLSHNTPATLYSNGNSMSITIESSNYSDIQNYTWDREGNYKINTLLSAFEALKPYGLWIVCDIKSGYKPDVIRLAAISGKVERIIVSLSLVEIGNYMDELKRYQNVKIATYASIYWRLERYVKELPNQIFAGMNVQGTDDNAIPNALACGVPLYFSGCTLENKEKWQILGLGCMANQGVQLTREQFEDALDVDYTIPTTMSVSSSGLTISVGDSASVTATSSVDTPCGYIYGYTTNPAIASTIQRKFGVEGQFDITGVAEGETELCIFSGNGVIKKIPVSVSVAS